MDTRNHNSREGQERGCARVSPKGGTVSMQLLVIMVPVLFGLMGFAVDLGRLYLIRGELNEAANAMALAAAGQLIGTSASLQNAATAMNVPLDPTLGDANMYNFGSVAIGSTTGTLSSTVATPTFFSTLTDAINPTSTNYADGTTAQYAQVSITADAPLLFWSLLTLGQSQKTTIAAFAAAGISAPLCTACSMEDFAVAALDQTDTVNFGFTFNTKYTFYFDCTGRNTISLLGDSTATVPYVLIDRYNSNLTLDETQQLFRIGAGGLIPLPVSTPNLALECFAIGGQEYLWGGAGTGATVTAPGACTSSSENQQVQEMLCGVYSRFDDPNNVAGAEAPVCTTITDLADIATAYSPDTDTSDYDDYTAYQGNGRRILTVPIVDSLQTSDTGVMNVLGFRQFFVTPTPDSATGLGNDPGDTHGRFMAIYIGSVAPVKQGYFAVNTNAFSTAPASACGVTSGPGKVVLHQ